MVDERSTSFRSEVDARDPLDTSWKKQSELYKLFGRSLLEWRRWMVALVLLFAGLAAIDVALPLFLDYAIGRIIEVRSMQRLAVFGSAAIAILVARVALAAVEKYVAITFSFVYTNHLRKMIFARLASRSYISGMRDSPGQLMAKLTYNIGLIRSGIEQWGLTMARQVVMFAGIAVYGLIVSPKLLLVTLGFIPLLVGFGYLAHSIAKKYANILQTRNVQINERMYEMFRHWTVVKLFRLEQPSVEEYAHVIDRDQHNRVRRMLIYAIMYLSIGLISTVVSIVIGWGMLVAWRNGDRGYGVYLLFIFYVGYLGRILTQVLRASAFFEAARVGVVTTFEYVPESLSVDLPEHGELAITKGALQLKKATFRYRNAKFRLRNISLDVVAGERLLILGGASSGKTTLLKLIKGALIPIGGTLRVDGQRHTDFSRDSSRGDVAYLSADPALLDTSWLRNLTLRPEGTVVPPEEMGEILGIYRDLGQSDLLNRYRKLFGATLSSEFSLSRSEAALACFVRSVRLNPKVILFDGFFSGVAPEFVEAMVGYVATRLPQSTVLYADHQPNEFFSYKRTLELRNGTLRAH